mmetsp:Transcript_49500/g.88460  ORF Transcript_49500/g.88460 Transcript_49500/m.88460 type:complete len:84 (-) Transcript_49500:105-356(-)
MDWLRQHTVLSTFPFTITSHGTVFMIKTSKRFEHSTEPINQCPTPHKSLVVENMGRKQQNVASSLDSRSSSFYYPWANTNAWL